MPNSDYTTGFQAATERDKQNLAASLRLRMLPEHLAEGNEERLSERMPRSIYADVFGVYEADLAFGVDNEEIAFVERLHRDSSMDELLKDY